MARKTKPPEGTTKPETGALVEKLRQVARFASSVHAAQNSAKEKQRKRSTSDASKSPVDSSRSSSIGFTGNAPFRDGSVSLPGNHTLTGKQFKALKEVLSSEELERALTQGLSEEELKNALVKGLNILEQESVGRMPKQKQVQKPLRDRKGYKPPTRANTVSIQAFVEVEVRERFKEIATATGVSAADLLRHLVENVVANGTDPSVQAAIAEENHRAESARKRLLIRITPGNSRKVSPS